jgi:hypothetical protein
MVAFQPPDLLGHLLGIGPDHYGYLVLVYPAILPKDFQDFLG